ncbi:DNA adenine methylase [Edaphobacter dinghuensis]|uniref:DNA methyltransferase n=1 Tax=Edaphobacter dinghuensis TaxID=1560005 RepID=A0A917LYD0_9BACT|nr:DNA adenine methylase [Edaphobacter dinghuensis]GGG65266.1 DNA methyltransferase [Edaphobacter dinghuensis]
MNLFVDIEIEPQSEKIVNVASVPQRSPFRYPGGKTWLVPIVRKWLKTRKANELIEPFAGGGIISLTVAFEELTNRVTMVECDDQVAAVWETIFSGGAQKLAEHIVNFSMTLDNVQSVLSKTDMSREDLAFQTILRNRVNHGGILAPGSGLLKHGENGKGLKSRWYADTLYRRITNINHIRNRVSFVHGDGMKVMQDNREKTDTVYFIDPPYTAAGKKAGSRLYTHSELDHEHLFQIAAGVAGDFLMTYDNAGGVQELARKHNFDLEPVSMKNTHHAEMTELLIGRDLDWVRRNSPRQIAS